MPSKGRLSKHKRYRTTFTDVQLSELQAEFANCSTLTTNRRKRISEELCLDEYTVKVWFQNQRQKNRRKGTKSSAGSFPTDSYWAPESPQPTDDEYIQSEVDEEDLNECIMSPKKLPVEQPHLDRGKETQCQTSEPSKGVEKRLTEEATCSQPVQSRGDSLSQPAEQVDPPFQPVSYPVGMFSWGQNIYTHPQLVYTHGLQQPWYQQHGMYQYQVPAHNFQHQFYGHHMPDFLYQYNPYGHYQHQHSDISQQQIPWQCIQHQRVPQQTTRQQYDQSVDDEKLDIAQIIQNTIHYLS